MPRIEAQPLRHHIEAAPSGCLLIDRGGHVRAADMARGSSLGGRLGELSGRSVAIATASQLTSALALIELDGVARRLMILPPDTDSAHLPALLAGAEIDAVVTDDGQEFLGLPLRIVCTPTLVPLTNSRPEASITEWVLLTSGTTGVPKMVAHSLQGLTAAITPRTSDDPVVWGTFYDIRRYGGLQIFLRAVLGRHSLILSSAGEGVADHLERLARHGVTHLSGTPSHWRRALMSPAIKQISPRYVRLSGEIADQAILDALRAAFPQAAVGHAYASTEAGVAFDVNDGLAGFPAAVMDTARDGVEMKIVDGSLRIRSGRTAMRYVGSQQAALDDAEGFIDTGDMLERHGDRYFFVGRRGGIINIGGLKVHPEEVEAVINGHPQVRMSMVRPKRSPITGAIVIADVVLKSACAHSGDEIELKQDILEHCRLALPRHKVPAAISLVPALAVGGAGKLARRHG